MADGVHEREILAERGVLEAGNGRAEHGVLQTGNALAGHGVLQTGTLAETALVVNKEAKLVERIQRLESVVVAYSGGVDSSLIAFYAKELLGEKAKIVIAVSPSLAGDDLEAARAQAMLFNWDLVEINTDEFENENYQRNDEMRCFYCKATLFEELAAMAEREGINSIIYGANADDRSDFRPGRIAAEKFNVIAPMDEVDLTKAEIRELARKYGLPSWDRPANACLSSRIPRDIPVTIDNLSQVAASEKFIKSLGFNVVRVRHYGGKAVVEIGQDELARLSAAPYMVNKIENALVDLGFDEVTIDARGYRMGSANASPQQSSIAAGAARQSGA